jgi:hypothetical protein
LRPVDTWRPVQQRSITDRVRNFSSGRWLIPPRRVAHRSFCRHWSFSEDLTPMVLSHGSLVALRLTLRASRSLCVRQIISKIAWSDGTASNIVVTSGPRLASASESRFFD